MSGQGEVELRRACEEDLDSILGLLQASLGWMPDDQYASFFRWKHHENPSGPSRAWVAVDGDRVVGLRTFLNWDLERGGHPLRAVRAVDTATHPDYQGRGIFSRLTLHALQQLRAEGVAFVFNTPNDKSRPGYLKMGWKAIGQVPLLFRPRSPGSLLRMVRARVPAEKWSIPTAAGLAAAEALADRERVARLLASFPPDGALHTRRTPDFLAWRYGFGPLAYRASVGGGIEDGIALFRARRRGSAREAAVCELLVPENDPRMLRRLLKQVLRESGADYAVRVGGKSAAGLGYLPVPGGGPVLLWKGLLDDQQAPDLDEWHLTLGDVELF